MVFIKQIVDLWLDFNKMERKVISIFKFKSTTVSGDLCNNTVTVFEGGVTYIIKRILTKKSVGKLLGMKFVCSKFGYNVFEEHYAMKFSSLMTIASSVAEIVKENDLKELL